MILLKQYYCQRYTVKIFRHLFIMEFDGSLTPPLTEDEDSDSDSLSCHHSPILNKRLKLDKTDEVIISSDNQSRTENDSHCDPLLDNNLFSIL